MNELLHRWATQYEHLTRLAEIAASGDRAAHIHAGLFIWVISALCLRVSLRSPKPVLVVAFAELINESIDRFHKGSWRWPDTIGDAIATLAWPIILMIGLNLFRNLRR